MARERTPLPFGQGLERAAGVMVVDPAAFSDLRNVHLLDGKAELRKGILDKLELSGVTDILAIASVRSQGVGVIVTHTAGVVSLWVTAGDGGTTAKVGDLPWLILAGALTPPRVIVADSYDKLLIAHDEPNFDLRNETSIYDVNTGLISNFMSPTIGGVKFRGVMSYLAYIIGWGYGTLADPDRPEIVRVSLPAEPTNFDINHYFVAGQRGDPVLTCAPAGKVLTVLKQSQSYDIFGYDRATFGIEPADRLFGVASSRLAVTVGDVCYRWTLDGPRISAGGASTDVGQPLDIVGPVPDALAASVDLDNGFAAYLPSRKEVLFVFGGWAYVLHVADPAKMRWSYRTLGCTALCAGILYDSGGTIGPSAHAELVSASSGTEFSLLQDANIVGTLLGGEVVEWWLKPYSSMIWSVWGTQPVGGASSLSEVLDGLLAGVPYDVAARIKRSGVAAAAYASSTPTVWPASSRVVGVAHTTVGDVTAASYVSADDGLGHRMVTITLGDTAFGQVARQSHMLYEIQIDRGLGAGFVTPAQPCLTNFFDGKVSSDFTPDIATIGVSMRVRQRTSFGTAFPYASAWSAGIPVTV